MSRRRCDDPDGGFTLVELLVAVVIEALIVGALGGAFIGILNGSKSVSANLSRSGDARIAAAYIIGDASNSSGPEVSLTSSTCTDPSPPTGTPAFVVQFGWSTSSSTGARTSNVVDYFLVSNSLYRKVCQAGAFVSDRAVAASVGSVTAVCAPVADCSGSPTSITVTVTETPDSTGSYQYSLTGAFRKLIGDGPPGTPQSVILLGSGSSCVGGATGLSMSTSANIRVYGKAIIDTADNGSCPAMNMTTSATFRAGSTSILAGGTCPANITDPGGCPSPITSFSPAITDPYATMAAPSAAALGLSAQSGCAGGKAYPGVYANQLSVSTSSSCQLQPGVYILNAGLSVSTSASLTSAGGVLLYIAGGSFSSSTSATVNISAQTINPGRGVAIWEPKTNSNTVSFSTSGSVTINGFIYAPSAAVNMSTSAANPTVTGIVAQNIIMSTSANLVVGSPSSPPLSITTTSLPAWPVGQPSYSATLGAAGGDGSYIWALSSGTLPTGLTFNASTGVISGNPSATGSPSLTFTLNDALGDDPDSQTLTLSIDALPTIASTSPASRGQSSTQNIAITGTGFINGAGLAASFSGTGITVNSTTWNSATQVTANITIAANATTGARNVTVTNPDTGSGTGNSKFTVNAAPTVTSASPASRGQGATQNIAITGTGFVNSAGLAASFSGSGITVNSTTWNSATQVTANITIAANATTGVRDVIVTNPDAGAGTGTAKFTVNTGPTVASTSPASRGQGVTTNVAITGTGFVSGTGLAASFSGAGITVNSTTWNSATQVTANVTIAANATVGVGNVTVTNPDGGIGTGNGVFGVNVKPTVASTNPASRGQGVTQNVAITGTGFAVGAVATFSGTGITVNSTTWNSATQVTANITIAANATTGARNVTVTNADAGAATGTGVFTVNVAPTITTISPTSHARNASGIVVTINGTGFVSGATVSFGGSNLPTITNTTWVTSIKMTVTITIPNSANTWSITVTNPDAGSATKANAYSST